MQKRMCFEIILIGSYEKADTYAYMYICRHTHTNKECKVLHFHFFLKANYLSKTTKLLSKKGNFLYYNYEYS